MICALQDDVARVLAGAVVVLPAVTYANVGELAVDVLVATLRPRPLGPLESNNVLPAVGNDAFDDTAGPGTLSTALELYSVEGRPLIFLQQRAPAMAGRQAAYAAELVGWLREAGVATLVVLTGLDAQLRRDQQLDSSPFRYLASSDDLRAQCASLAGVQEFEPSIRDEELELHHSLPPWPLVKESSAQGLPCVVLGCFAAEGDNAAEGLQLSAHALELLRAMGGEAGSAALQARGLALRTPRSWAGLYGRSYPAEIF
ncbi:Proteasome assembly chaperone 2 [Tetrabaena socialis]|uniref:Proteasome assembly chaperone 2 n=1 Tax=Tetrabaena socialis TaxID=47790 RepID=A0A2J7ZUT7_9CHLO|nr:Proteasome assembly chaperone 2 [Tetrabaena socialis]|eukprot:PNH04000.1 Proteasome assembly chaperone 2 [Tetrabaena socialis]